MKARLLIIVWSVFFGVAAAKPVKPHINSLDPSSAMAGASITLRGTGFSPGLTSNRVFFQVASGSSIQALVTAAATNAITVTVPAQADSGFVYVIVGKWVSNDVNFTLIPVVPPPPVLTANAGPDQSAYFGTAVQLSGASTGGNPPIQIFWTTVSGPSAAVFTPPDALQTTATLPVVGVYNLRLRASDNASVATDDVTVTITEACGATVSGVTSITATATDNVGVTGVQLQVDNINLGAELTTPPYTLPWNTTSVVNGCHHVGAIAHDAANNIGSALVDVTVLNQAAVRIAIPSARAINAEPAPRVDISIPPPTNLKAVCSKDGKSITLSWDPVRGALNYYLRVDYLHNATPNAAEWFLDPNIEYRVDSVRATTFTGNIVGLAEPYNWWVHTHTAQGLSPAAYGGFSCISQ